jgi:hypothetical protein
MSPLVLPLVAAAVLAAPAPKGGTRAPAASGPAVTYQTKERAFLNRGQVDGLAVGEVLNMAHEGRAAGTCKVEQVSAHAASCAGKAVRIGDTFKITAPPAAPASAPLPPVLSPAEISRREAILAAGALDKVEFDSSRAHTPLSLGGPVTVSLEHDIWTTFTGSPDAGTTFQTERLDVSVQGADISHGLRLYLDATAMYWTQEPSNARLPYTSNAVLLVRQTEVQRRQSGDTVVGAVGRILPLDAPGAPIVDGLQAGWRSPSGGVEVGAFGGLLPDPVTLAPATDRWTAGGYAAYTYVGDKSDLLRLFHEAFRVAAIYAPEPGYGTRVEAETAAQAWMARDTSVAGDVRFGAGASNAPGFLEAARLDIDSQPQRGFHLGASFRYLNAPVGDVLVLGAPSYATNGTHVDLTFAWTDSRFIGLSGYGGLWTDPSSGLTHGEIAPELSFPRLFGDTGGLAIGYQQELGWWGQRTAYLQTNVHPLRNLRFLARVLYLEDTPAQGAGDFNTDEVGAFLDTEVGMTSWLALHLGLMVRHNLGPEAPLGIILRDVSSSGLSASVGLVGSL